MTRLAEAVILSILTSLPLTSVKTKLTNYKTVTLLRNYSLFLITPKYRFD